MDYQKIKEKIDLDIVRKYPKEKLKEYRLVPVYKEGRVVFFASDKKPPLPLLDELEVYGQTDIQILLIPSYDLNTLINEYLEAPLETVEGMIDDLKSVSEDFTGIELEAKVENLEELAQEAPIIKLVNAIITTALKKNASDIHLEPFENTVKLRYRIDGILYDNPAPPRKLFPAITTRIKIMAGLNIAERRLPQEG
ncbi:MAG: Flp pilus assembly complex ATPase component TadA, partial [Halanaerobiaceae bacterium]|nr:Flp pilus assembly complex ATPase component TadA [Halanaerobiaceae bacterium]